jgi:hypothetical protein
VVGDEILEIVWALNDIFRPFSDRIKTIPYTAESEVEADRAIESFARKPDAATWGNLPGEVWRVLLERHIQLIMAVKANELAGTQFKTFLPLGLPESSRLPGIMLVLLHSMKLPYPVTDRSDFAFPAPGRGTSMTLH